MDKNTFQPFFTRREFIRKTATAGVITGISPFINLLEAQPATTRHPVLAVVKGPRRKSVEKALEIMGGMERFVKKNSRVVLKPNMSFPHPPQHATNTHYEVVATVAQLCMKAGARQVLVLDNPFNRPEPCLKLSGIKDACEKIPGVHVLAVTDKKFFTSMDIPGGKAIDRVDVIREILQCDTLINIPTAKSHTTTGVSLGMKGLMGLILDRRSFHSKVDINQAIADLNTAIRPSLTILDASRALTTGGPGGPGLIEYPGTIIAGTDPVSVDSFGVSLVKWYGQHFTGSRVKHIAAAHRMGLGVLDPAQFKIIRAET